MSSSSSSPREAYEEDREYESQAKRLKTEEGEIDYSAEEGENRREATPRGGGDGGSGGGGRSFSQPVTKRGAPSAVPGGSLGSRARWRGPGSGPPARLVSLYCCADPAGKRWLFSLGFYYSPYLFSASRSRVRPWPGRRPWCESAAGPELGEGRGRGGGRRGFRSGGLGVRLALC